MNSSHIKMLGILVFMVVLLWSAIKPFDTFTWFLEALPAMLGLLVILLTYKAFPLTPMLYVLILIHAIVLMVGAHYTYAEVPGFEHFFSSIWPERNNYDKLGHFAQGFVPAMICREIIVRHVVIHSEAWRRFFIVCFCLALSAFYELIEWWVALLSGEDADSFLGSQGYVWDTQSDMFLALIGSVVALLVCSHWHDKQITNIQETS